MSHLVASLIKLTDLDILRKAVRGFGGLTWNEGAKEFRSYGDTGKHRSELGTCEHSITVDKAHYQIGVIKNKDGDGWTLAFDNDDITIVSEVGGQSEKLAAAYGEVYVRDFAERNGFMVDESKDSEGNMVLTMTDNR